MSRLPLIRQGEGPVAATLRLELERVAVEQKLARIALEVGVDQPTTAPDADQPQMPTYREAPLLFMHPSVRRGFPFVGCAR